MELRVPACPSWPWTPPDPWPSVTTLCTGLRLSGLQPCELSWSPRWPPWSSSCGALLHSEGLHATLLLHPLLSQRPPDPTQRWVPPGRPRVGPACARPLSVPPAPPVPHLPGRHHGGSFVLTGARPHWTSPSLPHCGLPEGGTHPSRSPRHLQPGALPGTSGVCPLTTCQVTSCVSSWRKCRGTCPAWGRKGHGVHDRTHSFRRRGRQENNHSPHSPHALVSEYGGRVSFSPSATPPPACPKRAETINREVYEG